MNKLVKPVKSVQVSSGLKCKNCKFSFRVNEDFFCNKFRRVTYTEHKIVIDTKACRDDLVLCGEFGMYFEKK